MKRKRIKKVNKWLADLGPRGTALGKLIAHMNEAGDSLDTAVVQEALELFPGCEQGGGQPETGGDVAVQAAQGPLAKLSGLEVLDYLGKELGPEAAAMAGMLRRMYEGRLQYDKFEPQSRLGGLILRLALDEKLLEDYRSDPQSVIDAAELWEEEKKKTRLLAEVTELLGWLIMSASIHLAEGTNPGG